MSYDPRALGARCNVCPLRKAAGPVAPEDNGSGIWVVAQNPAKHEVEKDRPLVGPFGVEVNRAMQRAGWKRQQASYNNAFACFPDKVEYKQLVAQLRATNRSRERQGLDPIPTPAECCRPRLLSELRDADGIIVLGSIAAHSVLGGAAGIMDLRGMLVETPRLTVTDDGKIVPVTEETPWQVVPTVANVLHSRRWIRVFTEDFARAHRWFTGSMEFRQPRVTYRPSIAQIEAFLRKPREIWCLDVETLPVRFRQDGEPRFDPLVDRLGCIGIGDRDEAIVIPIVSKETGESYWPPHDERRIAELVAAAMEDPARAWVGHNCGYYDWIVLEQWLYTLLGRWVGFASLFDTILGTRAASPELPRSLGFCASIYSEEGTPAWKADHTATTAETDAQWWEYNSLDVVINARIAPVIAHRAAERDQLRVLTVDHGMQAVCRGLHRVGQWIDQDKRAELAMEMQTEMRARHNEACAALQAVNIDPWTFGTGDELFNPGSPYHIRDALYDRLNIDPPSSLQPKDLFTETGERSTAKSVMVAHLADPALDSKHYDLIEAIRRWRKASKLYGTYLAKSDPEHPETNLWEDGRVRADWKAHVTLPGRLAAAAPNLLNQPKRLRPMYAAAPGHVLVGADWSALHLRLIASLWGIPSLLEAFSAGLDVHALFAGVVFGMRFWSADGIPAGPRGCSGDYEGNAGKMRSVVKTMRYAGAYKASPATIWRVMRATEDKKGGLPYRRISPEYVEGLHAAWMQGEPQWEAAWNRTIAEWKRTGYLLSPILGRRCDFTDGELDSRGEVQGDIGNALVNWPILAGEVDVASPATIELFKAIPPLKWGPGTGLVNQNYDSMLVETPDDGVEEHPTEDGGTKLVAVRGTPAWEAATTMHDCMNITVPGLSVPMVADVKIGRTWAEVS